jgi:hypothetical protein
VVAGGAEGAPAGGFASAGASKHEIAIAIKCRLFFTLISLKRWMIVLSPHKVMFC